MLEEVIETARGNVMILFYACFVIPISLSVIFSPKVLATQEFKGHRLQHFDLQGVAHGSRSHAINMEARSSRSNSVLRKCVLIPWRDAHVPLVQSLVERAVGAVIIVIPKQFDGMSEEDRNAFAAMEASFLAETFAIPVFLVEQSDEIAELISSLEANADAENVSTAVQALLASFSANGFQIVTSSSLGNAMTDYQMNNIVGHLASVEGLEYGRSIVLVAHYDAFGLAPTLSYGADSNASGVAALLELARLLSKLYQNGKTRPKHNILFLLAGGGKFNYIGTKLWIEEQLEHQDNPVHNLDFALCLDAIGRGDSLSIFASKPPKAGSAGAKIVQELETVGAGMNRPVNLIHKKVKLGQEYLEWEHERFSFKRLPGYTLTHFNDSADAQRTTIMDVRSSVNDEVIAENVGVIAEAIGRYVYNLSRVDFSALFEDSLAVRKEHIASWLDLLATRPRSAQLFGEAKKDPLVQTVLTALDHWLHDVNITTLRLDKKDPEFLLFTGTSDTVHAYRVKPAIFDLILAVSIVAYLGLIYLFIANFFLVQDFVQRGIDQMKHKQI